MNEYESDIPTYTFYFFKLCEKFPEKHCAKYFLLSRDNVSQSVDFNEVLQWLFVKDKGIYFLSKNYFV